MKVVLELSMVASPGAVLVVGEVPAVPAVGDFISYEGKRDWYGYVASGIRWTYVDATKVVVRVWLQKDPPR